MRVQQLAADRLAPRIEATAPPQSRDMGDVAAFPTVLIDGLEYINNPNCMQCGGSLADSSWVRDAILRTRFHPDCWLQRLGLEATS
ncbi:MAG: hypothetical protein HY873_13215 [Chloroflexi bacterium]|nr:hypothetical protein [Chloroflexota bacterium]